MNRKEVTKHICRPKSKDFYGTTTWQCGCGMYFTKEQVMERKEAIEIAEREFSSIVCDGPFSIREQVIPLLADKIILIDELQKENEYMKSLEWRKNE